MVSMSVGRSRRWTYKTSDCPDVNSGRPWIVEGDFRSADHIRLAQSRPNGFINGSHCVCVLSVRVNERQDTFTFAVIHQAYRNIFKRSAKVEVRERFRTREDER
jgi:hypothetical protein